MGLDDKVPHEKGTVTESTVATQSGGQGLGRHERFEERLVDDFDKYRKYGSSILSTKCNLYQYESHFAHGDSGCCVHDGNVPFMKSRRAKTP